MRRWRRPWWLHLWALEHWLECVAGSKWQKRSIWRELLEVVLNVMRVVCGALRGANLVECFGGSATRPPNSRTDSLGTGGDYVSSGVEVVFGDACPVQGYGTVDGFECYYRSRGTGWQFHVYAPGGELFEDDIFVYTESPYFFPQGGWVSPVVSKRCIERAVAAWRSHAAGLEEKNCGR